jgi:hypothetical protein
MLRFINTMLAIARWVSSDWTVEAAAEAIIF